MSRIAIVDTETTGLSLEDDIWEFAVIVREEDGTEEEHQFFVEHDHAKAEQLPEKFFADYASRYNSFVAWPQRWAATAIHSILSEKIHVVGAVPNFDTERLALLLKKFDLKPAWHYHLIDVENLAVGYLAAQGIRVRLPWDSDGLSANLGINPDQFERHTALGDARWARAIYDTVTSAAS